MQKNHLKKVLVINKLSLLIKYVIFKEKNMNFCKPPLELK